MQIAELFVKLGIKGDDDTKKKLKETDSGLKKIKETSVEAKAAILAVVYGLERMMAASTKAGGDLLRFNSITGLSGEMLQRYQYAGRKIQITNEETAASVTNLQATIGKYLREGGGPVGIRLLRQMPGFDDKKIRDTFYLVQQLQTLIKNFSPEAGNDLMRGLGISDNVIAGLRQGIFNEKNLKEAPIISDKMAKSLNNVGVLASQVGTKIDMAFASFTSKHGAELVHDISMIVDQVAKLADSFTTLAKNLKVFELIGMVFEGWALIFKEINGLVEDANKKTGGDNKPLKKSFSEFMDMDWGKSLSDGLVNRSKESGSKSIDDLKHLITTPFGQLYKEATNPEPKIQPHKFIGPPSASLQINKLELNFKGDGNNSKQVQLDVQQGITAAFRQFTANTLVT